VFAGSIFSAAAALEKNRQPINELNVFPVPDGDTGTNMSLTMAAAAAALHKKTPSTVGAAAETAASALLRGARGNSGVILSLLFRGLARGLKGLRKATTLDLALAMGEGVDAAYKAVMKPTEGTILTVSKKAAAAAVEFAKAGTDVELMLVCSLEAARDALAETVEQNPVLKRAGVIDAGGKGYVVILEAMLAYLQGNFQISDAPEQGPAPAPAEKADFSQFTDAEIRFGYCTELIIRKKTKRSTDLLRAFLDSIGDSVVVVEDEEIIKTHAHTNDPGRILSEALRHGDLMSVKVEKMREQQTELASGERGPGASEAPGEAARPEEPEVAAPEKPWGTVVVCTGEGMKNLFLELGADRVVTGGQTMNPSTENILREVNKTPAGTVFVFPNNKNIIMAAQQCAPLTEKKVIVIPTQSPPQGISAMLSLNPDLPEEELVPIFTEAAERVHTALITYAARDSEFDGHSIRAGEYLGLLDGRLLGSYKELPALLNDLQTAFSGLAPEFISVYYGQDASTEDAEGVSKVLSSGFPEAEVSLINGGQPVYSYMISAE
jgi:DAK2 domain fusion protein YloV